MTIVFQGHIESLYDSYNEYVVKIKIEKRITEQDYFSIKIPKHEASHWLPGNIVNFTVYAIPPNEHANPTKLLTGKPNDRAGRI